MSFEFKNMFGGGKKEQESDVAVAENPAEKVLMAIEKDPLLKRAYASIPEGAKDKSGNDLREKFLKKVAENPGRPLGYDKIAEDWVAGDFQGFN